MSSTKNEAITKQSLLSKLPELVKDNNLQEIKNIIAKIKINNNWNWTSSNEHYLQYAARDAILLGHIEIIECFLNEGLSVNDRAPGNSSIYHSLISFAANSGNLAMVKLLVDHGADIRPYCSYYRKGNDEGIEAAVDGGHADIVDFLLEKGAKANGNSGNFSFLAKAAQNGNLTIVESLIKHGASISISLRSVYNFTHREYERYSTALRNYNEAVSNGLQEFDQDKQTFVAKCEEIKQTYYQIVKTILDYATGIDFQSLSYVLNDNPLKFLEDIDVSDFNFIGISVDGVPITHAMLAERKFKGAERALVSVYDLDNIQDISRQQAIKKRLETQIEQSGYLINNQGIVNLVPLYQAAKSDIEAVTARLKAGVNPNQVIAEGTIPLVNAAKNGNLPIVKILVAHPRIDKKTIITAIQEAKAHNHHEIAAFLSEQQDINAQDANGSTQLHNATKHSNLAEVIKLLDKDADVNIENKWKEVPLFYAAQKTGVDIFDNTESEDAIKILSLLLKKTHPKYHKKALNEVVKGGSPTAVKLMISAMIQKSDVIYSDELTEKEVHYPWYVDLVFDVLDTKNAIQILTLFKQHGAEFNTPEHYQGDTLLIKAIGQLPSFRDIVLRFRDLAFFIRGAEDRVDHNIFKINYEQGVQSAKKEFKKALVLLDFLLANGAKPAVANPKTGRTALHELVSQKDLQHLEKAYEEVIGRLIKYGADINAIDIYGCSPLFLAAEVGDQIAINYLFLNGANLNSKRLSDQRTPLHQAVANNFPSTAALLILLGADVNAQDADGVTPYQLMKKIEANTDAKAGSFQERRETELKYAELEKAFAMRVLNTKQIQVELSKCTSALAYYTFEVPELLRQIIICKSLNPKEIYKIVTEVFKEEPLIDDEYNELIADLSAINKITIYYNCFHGNTNEIIYAYTLKIISEKAQSSEVINKKCDMSLIKAMLDFNTDLLAKYIKYAPSLLRNGFVKNQFPDIKEEDVSELIDDLTTIITYAKADKASLRLRSNQDYTKENISFMVYRMALKIATEKANESAKQKKRQADSSSIVNSIQFAGGSPLHNLDVNNNDTDDNVTHNPKRAKIDKYNSPKL